MSVLGRVLLIACVCVSLSQTSQALTCYGCSWENADAAVGCDTSHTCVTNGVCYTSTGEAASTYRNGCAPGGEGCTANSFGSIETTVCVCVTHLCNNQSVGGSEDPPWVVSGARSPFRASSLLLPAVPAIVAVLMVTSQWCTFI